MKRNLTEGSSLVGTYLFKSKADAEGIGRMLGLSGTFPTETPQGFFWSPGNNEEELKKRVYTGTVLPATAHQPLPEEPFLDFASYLKKQL